MTEVFDAWTNVSYKATLSGGRPVGMPSWTGDHARRLAAYDILQSYVDNSARRFIPMPDAQDSVAGRDPADHREYGDAAVIVKTVLAGLLGHDQVIAVEGAELLKTPTEHEPSPVNPPDVIEADELQRFLRDWAKKSRFGLKLIETERNAISLGDGVYVIGLSRKQGRPTIRTFPPHSYFPVLDDEIDEEYPSKIHIAWELPPDPDQPSLLRIHRTTYELVLDSVDEPPHFYEYAPTTPSFTRCLMSEGTWTIDSARATIDDLTEQRVKWTKNDDGIVVRNLDIGVDFIPVIHVPNTVAEQNHYGESSLASVLQVLDDLAAADTDLQSASSTTGTPVIALSGDDARGSELPSYGPGTVFAVGDGHMTMMDTSRSLDALLKYVSNLLTRLSVNSRVPEAALGRINAAQVPSGIALALSFSPMEQMVKEMRQVRDEKYPLLFKFVLRFAMVAGMIPAQPMREVQLTFGNFLPTDRESIVKMIAELLPVNGISPTTAVLWLQQAGLPIDDAMLEVERIQSYMTQKALQLAQATGSFESAAEFLGIKKFADGGPGINTATATPAGTNPGPTPGTPSNNPGGLGTG